MMFVLPLLQFLNTKHVLTYQTFNNKTSIKMFSNKILEIYLTYECHKYNVHEKSKISLLISKAKASFYLSSFSS